MRKLGVNYNKAAGLSVEEALPLFRELGFDAIFTGFYGSTEAHRSAADLAERCGLYYESIHAPFGHINDIWQDSQAGEEMLAQLTDTVRVCGELSVPIAVVHLSSGKKPPFVNDLGVSRFDRLVELAERCGVTVAFENQRKLANLALVMERYEGVSSVGFCWDVGHEKCFADGREFMPLFGDRLVYTHIHDNLCRPDGDLHLIPFDGSIDFDRSAQLLNRFGFAGTLTLEILPKNSVGFYDELPMTAYYAKAAEAAFRFRELVEKYAAQP